MVLPIASRFCFVPSFFQWKWLRQYGLCMLCGSASTTFTFKASQNYKLLKTFPKMVTCIRSLFLIFSCANISRFVFRTVLSQHTSTTVWNASMLLLSVSSRMQNLSALKKIEKTRYLISLILATAMISWLLPISGKHALLLCSLLISVSDFKYTYWLTTVITPFVIWKLSASLQLV